jgi:hypothetical protein
MNWLPEDKLPEEISSHPGWKRLEDQRNWYSKKSAYNQSWFKRIKVSQIVLASAIPLIALIEASWGRWLTAGAGAVIAVLEAVQQLNQYSQLWIEYRSMAERLKRDKCLFLAGAGPYQGLDMEARLTTLALRVEELVSTEHERWVSAVTEATAKKPEAESAQPAAANAEAEANGGKLAG